MARTPIHPGEHLADELKALDMSAAALARALKVPTNRVTGIRRSEPHRRGHRVPNRRRSSRTRCVLAGDRPSAFLRRLAPLGILTGDSGPRTAVYALRRGAAGLGEGPGGGGVSVG